jgi:hypothetical protein
VRYATMIDRPARQVEDERALESGVELAVRPVPSVGGWHAGHQYVVRGSSVPCSAERIGVPQRGHGRPVRP